MCQEEKSESINGRITLYVDVNHSWYKIEISFWATWTNEKFRTLLSLFEALK